MRRLLDLKEVSFFIDYVCAESKQRRRERVACLCRFLSSYTPLLPKVLVPYAGRKRGKMYVQLVKHHGTEVIREIDRDSIMTMAKLRANEGEHPSHLRMNLPFISHTV
jgi:hypothetical protein